MGNIRNKLTLIVSESGSLRTHEKDYQIRVWHFLSASFFCVIETKLHMFLEIK